MLNREDALNKVHELIENPALIHHCLCVEAVMREAVSVYGTSNDIPEKWGLAGLLHDADWEKFPDTHPRVIVSWLRDLGEEEIAHAISAHCTEWGVSYNSMLDKALLACDELTGFIVACARLRPDGVMSLEAKSVLKKLRNEKFAAGVSRKEVVAGADLLGRSLDDHITFVIGALRNNATALNLSPAGDHQGGWK